MRMFFSVGLYELQHCQSPLDLFWNGDRLVKVINLDSTTILISLDNDYILLNFSWLSTRWIYRCVCLIDWQRWDWLTIFAASTKIIRLKILCDNVIISTTQYYFLIKFISQFTVAWQNLQRLKYNRCYR